MEGDMMSTHHKMVVTAESMNFVGELMPVPSNYAKGSVLDVTGSEREALLKDKNAADSSDTKALASSGVPIQIDAVERDIREGNFKDARGSMTAPDGSADLRTPPVGADASPRIGGAAGIQPMPGTSSAK